MIDLRKEEPFMFSQAPKDLNMTYSKLLRLANEGAKSRNGVTIYLETVKLEGGMGTTREAIIRFRIALND